MQKSPYLLFEDIAFEQKFALNKNQDHDKYFDSL